MTERKAFWHSLITVGAAAFIVAGLFLYRAGPNSESWPMYMAVIVVSALLLLPLLYFSCRRGPRREPMRRQYLKRVILFGLLASAYATAVFMEHSRGWELLLKCGCAGTWIFTALEHLRRAYKQQSLPETQ